MLAPNHLLLQLLCDFNMATQGRDGKNVLVPSQDKGLSLGPLLPSTLVIEETGQDIYTQPLIASAFLFLMEKKKKITGTQAKQNTNVFTASLISHGTTSCLNWLVKQVTSQPSKIVQLR